MWQVYKEVKNMANWTKVSSTSERLQEAMRSARMKQADLARATGLSKGGISNYVTGRYEPKSDIISKLAKALGVSEMWLWGYDVPKERVILPPLNLQLHAENSPVEPKLTEGEKDLLALFRLVPEDQQQLVLRMIRSALGKKE
jgi:transcriptional regulator with XRE-family HTH domain